MITGQNRAKWLDSVFVICNQMDHKIIDHQTPSSLPLYDSLELTMKIQGTYCEFSTSNLIKEAKEIKEKSKKGANFSNGTANKLPVGAKVYTTKEEDDIFLIVESEGETKKYMHL